MVRKAIRAGLFAGLGVLAVMLAYGTAATAGQEKKDDKLPDISEIMKKGHAKSEGYLAKINAGLKAGDWADVKKYAKDYAILGEALPLNKPEKGDEESWKKLAGAFAKNTKALAEAADKEDSKAAKAAVGALGKSCGECHKAHR
jgi:cytochrome c556